MMLGIEHSCHWVTKGGQLCKGYCSFLIGKVLRRSYKAESGKTDARAQDNGGNGSSKGKKVSYAKGSGRHYGVKYSSQNFLVTGEILFGSHPVCIALARGRRRLHKLYVKDTHATPTNNDVLVLAAETNVSVEFVPKCVLDQLSEGRPHQGVCLDTDPLDIPHLSPDDIGNVAKEPPAIWLLPYQVLDPMNMGAILRSSYFLGVDRVVLPRKYSATPSPMVSKASSGTLEVINLSMCHNWTALTHFLQDWKENGGEVIGTSSSGSKMVDVQEVVVTKPTVVIVGNEMRGVRDDLLDRCDRVVGIQGADGLLPAVDSLNVSVATGIVLHALRTNRRRDGYIDNKDRPV